MKLFFVPDDEYLLVVLCFFLFAFWCDVVAQTLHFLSGECDFHVWFSSLLFSGHIAAASLVRWSKWMKISGLCLSSSGCWRSSAHWSDHFIPLFFRLLLSIIIWCPSSHFLNFLVIFQGHFGVFVWFWLFQFPIIDIGLSCLGIGQLAFAGSLGHLCYRSELSLWSWRNSSSICL